MSHGYRNEQIAAYDAYYNIDEEFIFPMYENKSLIGKPKIFFIQSCKGSFKLVTDGAPQNDVFKVYATFEGM